MLDEAHWGFTPSVLQMIEAFVAQGTKVLGLTATPFVAARGGMLSFWEKMSFNFTIRAATDDGLLVPSSVTQLRCESFDLSGFKVAPNKDFNQIELDAILSREQVAQEMAAAVAAHYEGHKSICFTKTIRQAEQISEILSVRYQIPCVVVHSKVNPPEELQDRMDAFVKGSVPIIINVGKLIMGFDCPIVRNVFMCAPTASLARYMQQYGRGTRPLPGLIDNPVWTAEQRKAAIAESMKPDFRVFDLTDNCTNHSLTTAVDILAPEASDEVKGNVSRRVREKKNVTSAEIDAMVLEEMAEEQRRAAAIAQAEREMREHLRVKAEFSRRSHDPYAQAREDRSTHRRKFMPFGKYKGTPITAVKTSYLEWINTLGKNDWLGHAVRAELAFRAARSRRKEADHPSVSEAQRADFRRPPAITVAGSPDADADCPF
jgi:superfamily II DNA or RNA helicase